MHTRLFASTGVVAPESSLMGAVVEVNSWTALAGGSGGDDGGESAGRETGMKVSGFWLGDAG